MTFQYPLTIREFHLDTFGHVNNAVYLEIFEEARWDFITKRGYGIPEIRASGLGPVILEINIRFMREIHLRKEIVIHTEMLSYEGKVSKLKQWITDDAGKVCCEALFTVSLFDTKLRKIVAPTKEWLHALGMG